MRESTQPSRWRIGFRTPIGEMAGTVEEAGWHELLFPPEERQRLPPAPPGKADCAATVRDADLPPSVRAHIGGMKQFLDALFSGRAPALIPAVAAQDRSPFERAVRREMRLLAFGETVSYGELAKRAGRPGGARAVGQFMRRNPLPLVIPCHRVLASGENGSLRLGGFSGGLRLKRWLLACEGSLSPALRG